MFHFLYDLQDFKFQYVNRKTFGVSFLYWVDFNCRKSYVLFKGLYSAEAKSLVLLWNWYFFLAMHRGAFCQFIFQWIHCCHSSKSTRKETVQTHLCAMAWNIIFNTLSYLPKVVLALPHKNCLTNWILKSQLSIQSYKLFICKLLNPVQKY